MAHLSVQATAPGLSVRQMSGFSADVLRQAFAVSDDHEAYVVVAVGRHGDPVTLAEEVRAQQPPRARRLLAETVFASARGSALPAARQRQASPPSG